MNKFFNLYNSLCTGANSNGVFSLDPYFPVIKEMLVSELREVVYFIQQLKLLNFDMSEYTDKVVEFISVLIVNLDFKRESLFIIVEDLYNNKIKLHDLYINTCKERNIEPQNISKELSMLQDKDSVIKALNEHEKNIAPDSLTLTVNKKILYEIMVNLVLNACNCLIELKNYGEDFTDAKEEVLKLFNTSNYTDDNDDVWINKIIDFSAWNCKITNKLYDKINERFGPVEKTQVPVAVKEGKAILVSGSGLLDLEKILIAAQDKNINVYTHNNLMSAFQYKKISEYSNLTGHYQRLNNNFPLDFASFPGPVFITRNSAPKIEVIRGQIYTQAKYPSFGIAKIENDDFSPIIDYALKSEGFKESYSQNYISVGYNYDEISQKLNEIILKLQSNKIKNIAIIGLIDKFADFNEYVNQFLSKSPDELYIISFSYDTKRENVWSVNPFYDFPILYKIINTLKNNSEGIEKYLSIFFPDCAINTLSQIFNLKYMGIKNIFLGNCCPNVMNPVLTEGLKNLFDIKEISTVKDDIEFLIPKGAN